MQDKDDILLLHKKKWHPVSELNSLQKLLFRTFVEIVLLMLFFIHLSGHYGESHQALCVLSAQWVCPDEVSQVCPAKGQCLITVCV